MVKIYQMYLKSRLIICLIVTMNRVHTNIFHIIARNSTHSNIANLTSLTRNIC